ncbi:MAG: hypothetical protein COU67_03540 [Candidatus Pacebacteria bacterium CG10_big_fil_rev_8_21_14_0_10_44_54]|nr:MAG: hypothetical protein COU67_03540 [Candidatus Pacebacteria bacterium CG10_big_fil_rev_8_21_14_0_10_44_54]
MKITILYATYSNSTYAATEVLCKALQKLNHEVAVSLVMTANVTILVESDLTIFASPSWDYDGKEGQPHEDFFHFFSSISQDAVAPFSYAIMALGDTNYTYFCGAADELESLATAKAGKQIIEPLKLDQYYLNEMTCGAAINTWAQQLTEATT